MQEEITEKTISLVIRGTKITSQILAKALKKLITEMKKQQSKSYQGKQSLKNLVRQGAGVTNIEITNNNIKSFERVARKYGVDFALKKDATDNPPKWLVFFKARDTDALTAAFKEFSAKTLKKSTNKLSVIGLINKMKEVSKSLLQYKEQSK